MEFRIRGFSGAGRRQKAANGARPRPGSAYSLRTGCASPAPTSLPRPTAPRSVRRYEGQNLKSKLLELTWRGRRKGADVFDSPQVAQADGFQGQSYVELVIGQNNSRINRGKKKKRLCEVLLPPRGAATIKLWLVQSLYVSTLLILLLTEPEPEPPNPDMVALPRPHSVEISV